MAFLNRLTAVSMIVFACACTSAKSERTSMIGIKSARNVGVVLFKGTASLQSDLTDAFISDLQELDRFDIYGHQQIAAFLQSNNLPSDVTDPESRYALYKILGIDGVFTGEFITFAGRNEKRQMDNIKLTVRLISMETGIVSYSGIAETDVGVFLTGGQDVVVDEVVDLIVADIRKKFGK